MSHDHEPELGEAIVGALRSLPDREDSVLEAVMLQGLRRRMGLVETPTTVDRFVVLEPQGEGAMGVVYTAHDPRLERRVALKLVRFAGERGVERGLREARTLARLSHPNVVTVYEAGLHEGRMFVAMELVEGRTLGQWMRRPHGWREIAEVMLAAGRGLHAAHAAGVIHRDFKPDNVMVGERVRVVDFGLADTLDPDPSGTVSHSEPSRAASASVGAGPDAPTSERRCGPGTLAYMAAEQLRGEPADASTDQFAFCVTFFEALSGRRPFDASTPERRLAAIATPPTGGLESAPLWLRRLILRGLSFDAEHRFPDMGALLDALERRLRPGTRVGWVVAAMVSLTAAALAWVVATPAPDPCIDAAAAMETSWNPTRREQIVSVFEEIDRPYAAHAHRFVSDAADRYAGRWGEASIEACRTHLPGHDSTRRRRCLERRRTEFDALLTEFESADDALVRTATSAISALPSVDRCDRDDLMDDASSLEDDALARLAHIEMHLSRVLAMRLAGRYREASQLLEGQMPAIRQLDYEPILSEALTQSGRLQSLLGDHEAAVALLQEGLERSLASRADLVAATAAADLADARMQLDRPDRAKDDARLAAALYRRATGKPTWPLLANIEGMILIRESRDAEAIDVLDAGIAAGLEDEANHTRDLASMHANRGALLLRLGRGEEAERAMDEADRRLLRLIGGDHPAYAILLSTRAGLLSFRGDHEGGLRLLQRALDIWRRAIPGSGPSEAGVLGNMGELEFRLGRFTEALDHFRQALAIAEEHLDPTDVRIAMLHVSIGRALFDLGHREEGRDELREALALLDDAIEAREPAAGEALMLGAEMAIELEDGEWADTLLARGLEIYETVPDPPKEAGLRTLLARRLDQRGEREEALVQARRAKALLADTGLEDDKAFTEAVLSELMEAAQDAPSPDAAAPGPTP